MPLYEKDDSGYMYYMPPLSSEGKHYWVPIVVKNKDTLVAFTEGVWSAAALLSIEDESLSFNYSPSMFLSSDRLIDYTPDGRRLCDMKKNELIEYITAKLDNSKYISDHAHEHPDNDCDFSDYFLHVSCSCGNFIAYTDPCDIPPDNIECDMCGKTIVEYVHEDDENIMYEGINLVLYEELIAEIKEGMQD